MTGEQALDTQRTGQRITECDLAFLLARIFRRNGCSERTATVLAANCASAEAAGSLSHGIFRIDGYVSTLRSGWVDGAAEPQIEAPAPGYLRVDARNGFAQPAFLQAREDFVARIRANGIAFMAIKDSHHFGALWPDVTPFAEEGLIALSLVNSFACSIPAGAEKPLFGTNPIAFAAPIEGSAPLVFDFATTSMANGDVQIAARAGRMLPPGMGVDSNGTPTCNPKEILDGGSLVPFGGHKGSAISMMIELMVAGLTGGQFSFEVDWSAHPGAQTPRTGQIFIGIDPEFSGGAGFVEKAGEFISRLSDAGLTTYPGYRRWKGRGTQDIGISTEDYRRLNEYAQGEL
ncbi:Ldh family oxidoreductase [Paracoccus alkanivorans]|uniref:Delta(1)-pyrroline-2-carboxylate/Delta(1)-piperideine-2-carboxylate reductase n=1 Tax=Paracoccus alkanivorans TaxID=2116655 RepID=A0A3M0LX78_9RHOB|nr:Ldh family oxidoreductase [Paracoccus alkanivorans]RMC29811.1 Ldh family oxidoreductase [Paracoccus alkanivorans]